VITNALVVRLATCDRDVPAAQLWGPLAAAWLVSGAIGWLMWWIGERQGFLDELLVPVEIAAVFVALRETWRWVRPRTGRDRRTGEERRHGDRRHETGDEAAAGEGIDQ